MLYFSGICLCSQITTRWRLWMGYRLDRDGSRCLRSADVRLSIVNCPPRDTRWGTLAMTPPPPILWEEVEDADMVGRAWVSSSCCGNSSLSVRLANWLCRRISSPYTHNQLCRPRATRLRIDYQYDHHRVDNFLSRLDMMKRGPYHKPFGRSYRYSTWPPITLNTERSLRWYPQDISTEHTLGPYWKARKSCDSP